MTPLETSLIGFTMGIIGWTSRSAIFTKTFVRKDIFEVFTKNLEQTLKRIEDKLDELNGGKK